MSKITTVFFTELADAPTINSFGTNAQDADHALYLDTLPVGVCLGLVVAQQTSPNMTVAVGQGIAYDSSGQRVYVPTTQAVDVSHDSSNVSTTVTVVGNSRIVSVYAMFARSGTNPWTDGNGNTGYLFNYESFALGVVQGSMAVSPTAPSVPSGGVLLADVTIAYGQTTIVTGNIDLVTRRAFAWRIVGTTGASPHTILEGTGAEAMADMLGWFNQHVSGTADLHSASQITKGAGPAWANSDTNGATDLSSYVDRIITSLAAETGAGGTARIGGIAIPTGTGGTSIGAGTLYAQLGLLKSSDNLDFAPLSSGLTSVSVGPAIRECAGGIVTSGTTFTGFVTALAKQTASTGETLIGGRALTGAGFNLAAGTLETRVQSVINQAAPLTCAAFQHTAIQFSDFYLGGSYLETLGHTASGNPTHTVAGTSTSGTPSTVCTVTMPNSVSSGQWIKAQVSYDYAMTTQTQAVAMALYGSIAGGTPFAITGAIQLVPDFGSPFPALNVRTRASMAGMVQASTSGTLVLTLYVFIRASGDVWANMGGGGMTCSVFGPGM
jgi:hypothetical protein